MVEAAVLEQTRRAGVPDLRARPEHAEFVLDPLPGDPVVVGGAALRGDPQLLEDVARAPWILEVLPLAEPLREIADDQRVGPRLSRGIHRLVDLLHTPLGAADHPLVLLLQAAGEDEIRVMRGFGEEEVDHPEELELRQRFAREVGVRERHQRVEAHREEPLDLSPVDRVHDLLRLVGGDVETDRDRARRPRRDLLDVDDGTGRHGYQIR